ncbi:OmpA-OmpF porin, OOP family [Thalassovita litoralis]|jgi:OOP family OmpA-OmpF porin|uniref:OmpA-OmpF porin, OOP family n=1 Tax=Thalassovita litoralis TaxID=1010611 RepID=A0A521DTF9_9RHOB|nr:OmpA family protein [Thalassovita litoralis]SMO74987.1 OmpA-OmpF porin, OOP family [Thalassovita litoralis]
MMRLAALCFCTLFLTGGVQALALELPPASRPLADQSSAVDSYALPLGPFANGIIPSQQLEGAVTRQSWQVISQGLTSLQLFAPLRSQLEQEGYQILYECGGSECGGFDFRFTTEVLPAPNMHVDLTDFRFLSATKGDGDHLSLLVSRTDSAGFVQLIRVTGPDADPATLTTTGQSLPDTIPTTTSATPVPLAQALSTQGHAALSDLTFETGSSALGAGPFASLQDLATFLRADPNRRIALVGHTDAVGSLDNNMALSKRRAAAVLERLVTAYDIPRTQMEAEGMGYLSPVAPNQTDAGREANRRVEVVLLNTQ